MDTILLFKDKNGNIQNATQYEQITRGDIEAKITAATNELSKWNDVLAQYDAIAVSAADKPEDTEYPLYVPGETVDLKHLNDKPAKAGKAG